MTETDLHQRIADLERELAKEKSIAMDRLLSLNICAGAAGIGDHSELCGWIDKAKAELAEARKPLRWTSEVPRAAGLWAYIYPSAAMEFRNLSFATLSRVEWPVGTKFYGPIPEPMP